MRMSRLLSSVGRDACALLTAALMQGASAPRVELPLVRANPNRERAGAMKNGVLTVSIEAAMAQWRFNARRPSMSVATFAETGKAPQMPGPFIRVTVGTQIRFTIHNSLDKRLTFIVPAALHGGPDRINAMDSVVVAPGAVDTLSAHASVPGNFVYRGTVPDGVSKVSHIGGALAGAIIVDSAAAPEESRDRVFVIMATEDSASRACDDTTTVNPLSECRDRRFMYTINGTQWPNTDRIYATVGDSLHWRVINGSYQVHPMHLHGFYYRVDELSGPLAAEQVRPVPGQMVVTQLLAPLSAMSMTWSPDRPGNWLFHCHFALHNMPYAMIAASDDPEMRDMVGLVIGTLVSSRPGVVVAGTPSPIRRLRLVAESMPAQVRVRDSNPRSVIATLGNGVPQMHFVLEEHGRRVDSRADLSPEIDLTRGEPVAITVVNHLDEPTSVHWHGIEVEDSYMDGAPGFSGAGARLTPAIAPGDSFVARFTPPRSGTFMYHAHIDELREELAGLEGALIVRDSVRSPSSDDEIFFLKGEFGDPEHPLEIDGLVDPDTVVLHAGQPARLRLMNLSTGPNSAAPLFWLTARPDSAMAIGRDTMLVRWTPVAKDGFDLPAAARPPRPASNVVSVGETFDFEYTPVTRGTLRLEVRGGGGNHPLLIRVPIRVK
jgi:FtsP/CotA-like multicopper oxidase with cupredoxin domain